MSAYRAGGQRRQQRRAPCHLSADCDHHLWHAHMGTEQEAKRNWTPKTHMFQRNPFLESDSPQRAVPRIVMNWGIQKLAWAYKYSPFPPAHSRVHRKWNSIRRTVTVLQISYLREWIVKHLDKNTDQGIFIFFASWHEDKQYLYKMSFKISTSLFLTFENLSSLPPQTFGKPDLLHQIICP